jgi:hypothetical protein
LTADSSNLFSKLTNLFSKLTDCGVMGGADELSGVLVATKGGEPSGGTAVTA